MKKLVIIGGSDAGISAALRAREIDPAMDIIVLVADRFPNYSICGLPFYLSGEVRDWQSLAHRTAEEIERQGIRILMEHRATRIDPKGKTVTTLTNDGQTGTLKYDKLVVATGASPTRPPVLGLDLPGVFVLRWMEDGFGIWKYMEENRPASAIILGSGYIGMEMADSLTRRAQEYSICFFQFSGFSSSTPLQKYPKEFPAAIMGAMCPNSASNACSASFRISTRTSQMHTGSWRSPPVFAFYLPDWCCKHSCGLSASSLGKTRPRGIMRMFSGSF